MAITKGGKLAPEREAKAREAYRLGRETFAVWATMDAPEVPPDPVDAAQVQLARWQEDRFGKVPTSDPIMALGVIEELAETFDSDDDAEAAIDGLGDTGVYASQLCTRNRIAVRHVWELATYYSTELANRGGFNITPLAAAGQLAHVVVKHEQAIRGLGPAEVYGPALVDALALMLAKACEFAAVVHNLRIRPEGVFVTVANEVMRRKAGDTMIPAAVPVAVDQHHSQGVELVEARRAAAVEQLQDAAAMLEYAAREEPGDFKIGTRKAQDVLEGKPFDISDVVARDGICPQCAAPMSQDGSKPVSRCTSGHEFTAMQLACLPTNGQST